MKEQAFWYIENLNISKIFEDSNLENSDSRLSKKSYAKGSYIYLPEDSSEHIFFINEGQVKIGSTDEKAKEVTKIILGKGEIFGELAMIGQEKRNEFALAMEETLISRMSLETLKLMMKQDKKVSSFFMKLMGNRMTRMEQRLESLVFKNSRTRIIDYILEMYEKGGERVGYEYVIRNVVTHQDIANITATSRQTVTTVLNELRAENIISFNRRRLLIRDLDRLKKEVEN